MCVWVFLAWKVSTPATVEKISLKMKIYQLKNFAANESAYNCTFEPPDGIVSVFVDWCDHSPFGDDSPADAPGCKTNAGILQSNTRQISRTAL